MPVALVFSLSDQADLVVDHALRAASCHHR